MSQIPAILRLEDAQSLPRRYRPGWKVWAKLWFEIARVISVPVLLLTPTGSILRVFLVSYGLCWVVCTGATYYQSRRHLIGVITPEIAMIREMLAHSEGRALLERGSQLWQLFLVYDRMNRQAGDFHRNWDELLMRSRVLHNQSVVARARGAIDGRPMVDEAHRRALAIILTQIVREMRLLRGQQRALIRQIRHRPY